MRPPLNALRSFEAAARCGSFKVAAEELGVTQAAVSFQVRALEDRLDRKLFVRSRNELTLTKGGRELAEKIRPALSSLNEAVTALAQPSRRLRLTTTPTFLEAVLLPRLWRFEARHPEILVELEASSEVRDLRETNFALAIRSGRGEWVDGKAHELFPLRKGPALARSLAEELFVSEPSDLLRCPLLRLGDWKAWFMAAGVSCGELQETGPIFHSQHLAAAGVKQGRGAALLTEELFRDEVRRGELLFPFSSYPLTSDHYYLVTPSSGNSSSARIFAKWLLEELRS